MVRYFRQVSPKLEEGQEPFPFTFRAAADAAMANEYAGKYGLYEHGARCAAGLAEVR
jgi:hypothetical protein